MREADQLLLRLSLTPGIGSRVVARLLAEFRSVEAAWQAPAREWVDRAELPSHLHRLAHSARVAQRAQQVRVECRQLGITIITLASSTYPQALSTIYDPPPVLYVRGQLPDAGPRSPFVAIVGTRKASTHGLSFTYRLAAELSGAGTVIVSGLANGIDAEAHRSVVDCRGVGVAVLAGGLDAIHPPANQRLGENLCEKGCLLSEHPPGTSPRPGFFVGRNRIISGLSRAVAVIEAGVKSGALLTAEFAVDQNRSLFVMPGRPGDPRVAGSLPLLQDGAELLLSATDIASELGLHRAGGSSKPLVELGDDGTLFAHGGASFDAILAASGLSAPQLLSTLTRLELAGRIGRGPDGFYYRLER